jgi:hypothetical protein
MTRALFLAVIAVIFGASSQTTVSAQESHPHVISGLEADVTPDSEIVAEQYLLLGTATRGCGESQVAVNPRNPAEIVVSAMCILNQQQGKFEHNELEFERTPRATITEFAVTRDRGLTWTYLEDPMRDYFHRYRCLDPFAAFAADGTMILGCEAHFPVTLSPEEEINEVNGAPQDYGGSAMIWSTDGGLTFSDPVQIISSFIPKEILGPFVSFAHVGSQGDRPEVRVDLSTGKIYLDGHSQAATPPHRQTVVRMSKDRGRDWGMVYAFDSTEWPESGFGGTFDAANGVMGAVYIASSVPAALHAQCPCRVFGASSDDGKTFERYVVPAPPPTSEVGPPNGMAVVANPTKKGAFSVLVPTSNGIDTFLTENEGKTWTQTQSVVGVPSARIANLTAAYGPTGILAVAWREIYPLSTPAPPRPRPLPAYLLTKPHVFVDLPEHFEVWSAISRDRGRTFSPPLKVSTAQSPGISRRRDMDDHGNDFISVAVDKDFVHMTWFDDRAGFRATWYGRVPIANYK